MRVCINYIPLNATTLPAVVDPPLHDVIFQKVAQAKWFSKVDIEDAYNHLALHPDSCHLTAFTTPWGTFEYTVLPFGWSNAPAIFQVYMEWVLRPLLYDAAIAFQDDIIVFSDTKQQHHVHLRQTRRLLATHGLRPNEKKSVYIKTSLVYLHTRLAHMVVEPIIPHQAISDWPIPRSRLALQRFIGTVNVFRNYIPSFAGLAEPLYKCTGEKWVWGDDQTQSFHRLKAAVRGALSLAPHVPGQSQDLIVDASLKCLGVILKENSRPIAVISRLLSQAERNYDTTERELLAVVWGLERLYHMTAGATTITVHTDHMDLVSHLKPSNTVRRRNRWIEWLARFRLKWTHVRGADNPADGPSRLYE
jgi:hypothetical protein